MIKSARTASIQVQASLTAIVCNSCKKEVRIDPSETESPFDAQETHSFQVEGSYSSKYPPDMTTLSFELCADCLQGITSKFLIPPSSSSYFHIEAEEATNTETGEQVGILHGKICREGFLLEEEIEPQEVPEQGVWKHFKGGLYEVLGYVVDPQNKEVLVSYSALYGDAPRKTLLRPLSMWFEEVVNPQGEKKPRFTQVSQILDPNTLL